MLAFSGCALGAFAKGKRPALLAALAALWDGPGAASACVQRFSVVASDGGVLCVEPRLAAKVPPPQPSSVSLKRAEHNPQRSRTPKIQPKTH